MKTRDSYLVCARLIGAVVPFVVPALLTAQATQSSEGAYGFVRVADGSAYLVESGTGQRTDVQANEPLLTGDHVFVAARSRVELLLSDGNIARLGDRAELEMVSLAGSPDGQADHTILRLRRGTLQLVVADDFVGGFFPTVETPHARVEVAASGSYLLTTDGNTTVLTVRSGAADVLTDRGSDRAEAGDELLVDGSGRRAVRYARAGSLHSLERWGDGLTAAAYGEEVRYVDAGLAYAAAPLARYGRWVSVGGRNAWYPHHRSGWRPYWNGHWRHTPTGLLWVSYEPWGWVPYHYGVWDEVPGYGWLWFPGRRFAPAWVAWYWGPAYVGWAPLGFYAGYYSSGFSISIGLGHYGWAHGPAHRFRGFTFVPGHRFGRRHQHKWARRGYDLGQRGHVFKRGIITTDTRSITPPRWRRPADVVRELNEDGRRRRGGRDLPDVSPHSGRVQRLPAQRGRVALNDAGPRGDRARGASDRTRGASDRPRGASDRTRGANDRARGASGRPRGANDRARGANDRTRRANDRPRGASDRTRGVRGQGAPTGGRAEATPNRRRPRASDGGGRSARDRTARGRRQLTSRTPERRSRVSDASRPSSAPRAAPPRAGRNRPEATGRPSRTSRPSRAGPGAERGRVKTTEQPSRRSGPETRSRDRPEVTRPIRESRGSSRSTVGRARVSTRALGSSRGRVSSGSAYPAGRWATSGSRYSAGRRTTSRSQSSAGRRSSSRSRYFGGGRRR